VTEAETKSRSRSQGESSTKSRSKPQGGSRIESQGGERPRHHEARQSVSQGDVDTTLVGKRVVIAVSVGNKVVRITGTITVMGRFWVVVNVESSELPAITGTVYLNKGSVIAYMPIPGSNHDSNPKP